MSRYIQFDSSHSGSLLVEVSTEEIGAGTGVIKSGLQEKLADAVAIAQTSLEDAVTRVVHTNAALFIEAVEGLERQPTEMEITFGVKATGELGNAAVAKAAGEGNYTVRLKWIRKEE